MNDMTARKINAESSSSMRARAMKSWCRMSLRGKFRMLRMPFASMADELFSARKFSAAMFTQGQSFQCISWTEEDCSVERAGCLFKMPECQAVVLHLLDSTANDDRPDCQGSEGMLERSLSQMVFGCGWTMSGNGAASRLAPML